jgi:chaperone LolA
MKLSTLSMWLPLALLGVLLTRVIAVGGEDVEEILARLQKKYEAMSDVTCHFTQTVQFSVTHNEQQFKGVLYMKKGNRYRIETDDQTIVTDGTSVWSYSPSTNQVLIDHFREDPRSITPDKVLMTIPTQYNVVILSEETIEGSSCTVLKCTPKDQMSNVKWMKVWISEDQTVMKKIQIQDVNETTTSYVVGDLKFNTSLPDSRFQFKPPQGAEVVDLR